jgi:hypothetical protein
MGILAHLTRGFRVYNTFVMTKEKLSKSHLDVIPAVANFIGEAFFQEDIQDLPTDLLEIFELFLETEQANSQPIRVKMLRCLKTARTLDKTLQPFTKEQVEQACQKFNYN